MDDGWYQEVRPGWNRAQVAFVSIGILVFISIAAYSQIHRQDGERAWGASEGCGEILWKWNPFGSYEFKLGVQGELFEHTNRIGVTPTTWDRYYVGDWYCP